jgi:hypothetical protein
MSDRYRFRRLMFRRPRLTPAVLACGLTAALLLSLGSGALAAGATKVVPPKGKVAGHGYAYWLQRSWQIVFSSSPPVNPCQSLPAKGQHVGYLTLKTIAPGTDNYTCSEPAGRPIYMVGLSNECSTFKGDHGNFGTSNSQLKRCARALFKGAQATTTLDGHPVNIQKKLVAATGVYPVHAPKNNILGVPPGTGRSAAYGYGLLLAGFSKGTHTLHSVWSIATSKWDITFTVHVH